MPTVPRKACAYVCVHGSAHTVCTQPLQQGGLSPGGLGTQACPTAPRRVCPPPPRQGPVPTLPRARQLHQRAGVTELCCAGGPLGLFPACPAGSVLRGQVGPRCCVSLGKVLTSLSLGFPHCNSRTLVVPPPPQVAVSVRGAGVRGSQLGAWHPPRCLLTGPTFESREATTRPISAELTFQVKCLQCPELPPAAWPPSGDISLSQTAHLP